jgi:hypothetical protein
VKRLDHAHARPLFEATFREYGMPQVIRTDNGEPFASVGLGGLSGLSVWWMRLGIQPERIRPGKPQENGRHERMHRTLKQATAQPAAGSLRQQQKAFDHFRREYNEQRPHAALEMKVPAACYEVSLRAYPRSIPEPGYPAPFVERRVGPCGTMKWAGEKIFISSVLAGQTIGLEPWGEDLWRLWFCSCPLALFDERQQAVRKLKPEKSGKAKSATRSEPTSGMDAHPPEPPAAAQR